MLDPYEDAEHDLTDMLGDNQGLHVLRETLIGEPDLLGSHRDAQVVLALARRQQADLRARAEPLARRIHAERPKAARADAYWQAAVACRRGDARAHGDR